MRASCPAAESAAITARRYTDVLGVKRAGDAIRPGVRVLTADPSEHRLNIEIVRGRVQFRGFLTDQSQNAGGDW
jgi:hypothetical protein